MFHWWSSHQLRLVVLILKSKVRILAVKKYSISTFKIIDFLDIIMMLKIIFYHLFSQFLCEFQLYRVILLSVSWFFCLPYWVAKNHACGYDPDWQIHSECLLLPLYQSDELVLIFQMNILFQSLQVARRQIKNNIVFYKQRSFHAMIDRHAFLSIHDNSTRQKW